MLSKKHKLNLSKSDNRAVLRSPHRLKASGIMAVFDYEGDELVKVEVIVLKKHIPLATKRNKLRRQVLQAIPTHFFDNKGLRLIIRINSVFENKDLEMFFSQLEEKIAQK